MCSTVVVIKSQLVFLGTYHRVVKICLLGGPRKSSLILCSKIQTTAPTTMKKTPVTVHILQVNWPQESPSMRVRLPNRCHYNKPRLNIWLCKIRHPCSISDDRNITYCSIVDLYMRRRNKEWGIKHQPLGCLWIKDLSKEKGNGKVESSYSSTRSNLYHLLFIFLVLVLVLDPNTALCWIYFDYGIVEGITKGNEIQCLQWEREGSREPMLKKVSLFTSSPSSHFLSVFLSCTNSSTIP